MTTIEKASRMFFRLSNDLNAAIAAQDNKGTVMALNDILGFYMHETNSKIRARYAALLERHGWSEQAAQAAK